MDNQFAAPNEHRISPATSDRQRRIVARLLLFVVLAALAVLVGLGIRNHLGEHKEAEATLLSREKMVPTVRTIAAEIESKPKTLELSGNMAPYDRATIRARATGYISERLADLGSKVHKGDLLAVIAAPDLDKQLSQARAQLIQDDAAVKQVQASAELGRVTNNRTSTLVKEGWSTLQKGDEDRLNYAAQTAAVDVAKAQLEAQREEVGRLEKLVGFERIVAPFDGIVTARNIDVGSLVTADVATATPLFSMERTDTLRIQVYVPQSAYFGLVDGDRAKVTVPDLPGRSFEGHVARSARVLSDSTRTILTEVDVDNHDGALTAGLYCTVHFEVHPTTPVVRIPSTAVIFTKNGLQAAIVRDNRIKLVNLELEADDGAQVEVRQGLGQGDRVVLSPPVGATDGLAVHLAIEKEASTASSVSDASRHQESSARPL
jgi:RND family efflux transporter MFP subunit